jgi:hypothetical protein
MAKNQVDVNWINYIGGNNSKKPAELFLAQAPVSVSGGISSTGRDFF